MTEAVLLPFNIRPATAVSIACCSFFFGLTEPAYRTKGFKILARFAGISSSLWRLFFPFSAGRSISERSSFISVQSRSVDHSGGGAATLREISEGFPARRRSLFYAVVGPSHRSTALSP